MDFVVNNLGNKSAAAYVPISPTFLSSDKKLVHFIFVFIGKTD